MDSPSNNQNDNQHHALFPHEQVRPIQDEVIKVIAGQIGKKGNAIIHAPTGLGKTAASLAPALKNALDTGKTVFFLTSRNTQHKIAIETLKEIRDRHHIPVKATDFVGKKWMCIQPGVNLLSSSEFAEYCRALREDKKCSFYERVKNGEKLTTETKAALDDLGNLSPVNVDQIVASGQQYDLCPYELALLLAAKSNVIITDYYYLFHPDIREHFLTKNDKTLQDSIIIVDEAHNLPYRIKDLASEHLSTTLLKRAITEAKKHSYGEAQTILEQLHAMITKIAPRAGDERHITKGELTSRVSDIAGYEQILKKFHNIADDIREQQKQSAIGGVASFLDKWLGMDDGFTRIINTKKGITADVTTVSYRCLDPSVISREIIAQAAGTILMSGTLTPPEMYLKLLGFPEDKTLAKVFPSPFPEKNRLNMIVAKTSTKYSSRGAQQYHEIAKAVSDIINATPGNSAIFFPSYKMKDDVGAYMENVEKTIFQERKEMSQEEREDMIARFRSYHRTGAALLGVVSGSFGEGIDLPGDELKTVVVVGLPLARPDLETKALIDYYNGKFGDGWNYGYVYPAFNKIIQSAGRCIRSKNDKGVIVFLDERFTWPRYYRCFPETWNMKVSVNRFKEKIERFFSENGS
ncbi:MAG: ATP-dependent DNA helicase [Candidatus Woesearchaeota archaeon]